MITTIELEDLRGVRQGNVGPLAPLTVLVGPNGAGKSAVLEAIAIGASHRPGALVGQVVHARGGWGGAAYLVRAGAAEARVRVVLGSGAVRSTRLRFQPTDAPLEPAEAPPDVHPQAPLSSITLHQAVDGPLGSNAPTAVRTLFALNNAYGHRPTPELPGGLRVRLLHPVATRSHPLWRTLSEAVRSGRAQAAVDLLRPVLGADLQDLLYLPEGDDGRVGNVHLRYPWGAVPVDVAGDGARALVRIALELAAQPAEVVLIEEPEVHLHPGAIWAVARALLEARRGGVQLILSTHSLELIDALVAQAGPTLDDVAVIRLVLADGNLRAHTIPGAELALLRGELAEELR